MADSVSARRKRTQRTAYVPHDLVICTLPYRRMKELEHERKDGEFSLRIYADPRTGLPYGQDRLVFYWIASAFKQANEPENNILQFGCANDILRAFGFQTGGHERRMLRDRFLRILGATVVVDDPSLPGRALRGRFHFIDAIGLWFDPRRSGEQSTLWQNVIKLNDHFANDIRRNAVPLDLETMCALRTNMPALDLYNWQGLRSYRLLTTGKSETVAVPLFGQCGLQAQLGSMTKKRYRARQMFRQWQKKVCEVWPDCPNELTDDGNTLLVRPGRPIRPGVVRLPGVSSNPPIALISPPHAEDYLFDLVRDS